MNHSYDIAYTVVYFIVLIVVMSFISKILYESYHRVRIRRQTEYHAALLQRATRRKLSTRTHVR